MKNGWPKTAVRPGRLAASDRPARYARPRAWIDRSEFDEDLASAERAPDDIERFNDVSLGYIEDVLAWLERSPRTTSSKKAMRHHPWTISPGTISRIRTSR
jgi:hypothetical protein